MLGTEKIAKLHFEANLTVRKPLIKQQVTADVCLLINGDVNNACMHEHQMFSIIYHH